MQARYYRHERVSDHHDDVYEDCDRGISGCRTLHSNWRWGEPPSARCSPRRSVPTATGRERLRCCGSVPSPDGAGAASFATGHAGMRWRRPSCVWLRLPTWRRLQSAGAHNPVGARRTTGDPADRKGDRSVALCRRVPAPRRAAGKLSSPGTKCVRHEAPADPSALSAFQRSPVLTLFFPPRLCVSAVKQSRSNLCFSNDLSIENRVAVVIGGTSGIGRAFAVGLARHGAHVVATGRREKKSMRLPPRSKRSAGDCSLYRRCARPRDYRPTARRRPRHLGRSIS